MHRFQFHRSRIFLFVIGISHFCAAVLVVFSSTAVLIKLIALLLCMISLYFNLENRRHSEIDGCLQVLESNSFTIVSEVHPDWRGYLGGQILSTPLLIILTFQREVELSGQVKQKRRLVLFRDSMDSTTWRRLRVFLKTSSFL